MKKFLAIILSVVIPALSFGTVQYADGMFTFDKDGDLFLRVIEKGTTFGQVGEVGYFISIFETNNQMLDEDLKGSDKILGPMLVEQNKSYGFYMELIDKHKVVGTYASNGQYTAGSQPASDYFSYDPDTYTASFTLLNGSGNGMGNNTLTFTLYGSAVGKDLPPTGTPLPGTMTSIALCMGAVAAAKRFGKKKQSADKN